MKQKSSDISKNNVWKEEGEEKMKKEMNSFVQNIGIMLFLCLIIIGIPQQIKADERIQCGENVYAVLDASGTLTISGTGDMWDNEYFVDIYFHKILNRIHSVVVKDGVTSIGAYAFCRMGLLNYNSSIRSVSISDTVKKIGKGAFSYCAGLRTINIPGSVQNIEKGAFESSGLVSCIFNPGLKIIEKNAFRDTSLRNISIPEGVRVIEDYAFKLNSDNIIPTVLIPKDIGAIRYAAFSKVYATIYSMDVFLAEGAFGAGSVLTVERGSTAEKYALNDGYIVLKIFLHEYNITFEPNGGTVGMTAKTVKSDTICGTLPVPKRKGYLFKGWYTAPEGGSQMLATTIVRQKTDFVLYAHWKQITVGKGKKLSVRSTAPGQMLVSYKKVGGAKGYQIRYSRNPGMRRSKTVSTKSRSKTIHNLLKGKKYYVQVRAYKKDSSGAKVYGDWSTEKKVRIRKKY